ncbi:hypothetical protein O6H91_12G043200 [Diphasiastrum complanatum]|uniref:Uncharacterized protein n=1 Tax=Diphasiastrum complanatum TaxID=34168 RepID=A0ACC2C0Z6_DIPCM|nr:hypothetical protein O6H91_12G043200 [Diphasiastrum complanatum]
MSKDQREKLETFEADLSAKLRRQDRLDRKTMNGSEASSLLNTVMPCAACKLLRRRCSQECPFLPYFSPHEPQKFASVHKIFGASNVSKMLMEVPKNQRLDVANSLVYEANARIQDPVYGCVGAISSLQQQAQSLEAQLNAVRVEIMHYHSHKNASSTSMVQSPQPSPTYFSSTSTNNSTCHDLKNGYSWSNLH